jgi:2-polyprenyl-3-methyl-5-hydroxy-6-metoxy-1,4-benzoquinol methylase
MEKVNRDTWEEVHATRRWGAYPPEDVVRFVATAYKSLSKEERKPIRVLDVGCGQGAVTWFLAREGFDATGIDFSPSAIEKARAYVESNKLEASFAVEDFTKLSFEAESFDCILDIESIYTNTSADIKKIYADLYRLLKPGGVFFTMSFSTACSNFGTGVRLEEHTFTDIPSGSPHTGVAHYFDRLELKGLLTETGFKEIEINSKEVTRQNGREVISQWIVYGKK